MTPAPASVPFLRLAGTRRRAFMRTFETDICNMAGSLFTGLSATLKKPSFMKHCGGLLARNVKMVH